jgi:hypothetical protein
VRGDCEDDQLDHSGQQIEEQPPAPEPVEESETMRQLRAQTREINARARREFC